MFNVVLTYSKHTIDMAWPYLSTLTSYMLPYPQTHPDVDEGIDTGASVPVKLGPHRMLSPPLSRPTSRPIASLQIERPLTEALGTIQPPLQSQLYKDRKLKVTIHTGSVQCVVTRHRSLNSTHRKQDTYNLLLLPHPPRQFSLSDKSFVMLSNHSLAHIFLLSSQYMSVPFQPTFLHFPDTYNAILIYFGLNCSIHAWVIKSDRYMRISIDILMGN